jgi:hypothetical protein
MIIVVYTDFSTGPLKMTFSTFQQADFAAYVTAYEKDILRDLLNDKLQYEINALSSLTGKYADLINGCSYTDSDGNFKTNAGLKEVLKRFINYYYSKDNFQISSTGKNKNKNENADAISNAENTSIIYSIFNQGVDIWNNDVIDFLTEFYSQEKTITAYTVSGTSYTILSSNTGYLINGDTVTINGKDYTVSNVVVNTSFDITGTGITPSGTYTFYPFKDVDLEIMEHAYL